MSVKTIFKEKEPELFWQYWQKFIFEHKESPRYLKASIEYNLAYANNIYCDKSFVYLENNEPLACVFLPIEKDADGLSASFQGGYIDAPVILNKKVEKKVFLIIDEIARENNVSKIKFAIDVLSDKNYNYLIKYGYLDSSILTYVIDLTSLKDLFKSCRENHRRNIKKIKNDKIFLVFYSDKKNSSYEIHEEYRELHHKCAGKVTRSKETFDFQFQELKQGNAVLFGLKYKGKNIAFVYFKYYKDKAIYSSAADDPDYNKFPLYHILIYSAMKYLKKRGVCFIDTGQPSSPSSQIDYYPDKKQLNIALFKCGFGGEFKHYFRGIKYFSKKLFKEDIKKFTKNYSLSIYEKNS